jgi:hypothetical protein
LTFLYTFTPYLFFGAGSMVVVVVDVDVVVGAVVVVWERRRATFADLEPPVPAPDGVDAGAVVVDAGEVVVVAPAGGVVVVVVAFGSGMGCSPRATSSAL